MPARTPHAPITPSPTIPSALEDEVRRLIAQLADDNPQRREAASERLLAIGPAVLPAIEKAVGSPDPEVRTRAQDIKEIVTLRQRITFSERLLKWYPDIYRDLSRKDTQFAFGVLQTVTAMDEDDRPLHDVVDDDILAIIGEVMNGSDNLLFEQKNVILAICAGEIYSSREDGEETPIDIRGGWCRRLGKTWRHLRSFLADKDSRVRAEMIERLVELGGRDAIPDAVAMLKDEQSDIREQAMTLLVNLGASEVIPEIQEMLGKDKESSIRLLAMAALIELGAKNLVPVFRNALQCDDSKVRYHAAVNLLKVGDRTAIDHLRKLLKDDDQEVRLMAAQTLSSFGDKAAEEFFIAALRSEERSSLIDAIQAIRTCHAKTMAPYLVPLFTHSSVNVRQEAVSKFCGLTGREAIPQLVNILDNDDPEIRMAGLNALSAHDAKETIPRMIPLLKDQHPVVRRATVIALADLGATEALDPAVELLETMGEDVDDDLVENIVESIVKLSQDQIPPRIVAMIKREDYRSRQRAAIVIRRIESGEGVSLLLPLLGDRDPNCRLLALGCLPHHGERLALSNIAPLLNDADETVRREAIRAVGRLGGKDEIAQLIPFLGKGTESDKTAALEVLIALNARGAVKEIAALRDDESPEVRMSAIKALLLFDATVETDEVLAVIEQDEDGIVRADTIAFLAWLDANEVAPRLMEMLKSEKYIEWRGGLLSAIEVLNVREALSALVDALANFPSDDLSEDDQSWSPKFEVFLRHNYDILRFRSRFRLLGSDASVDDYVDAIVKLGRGRAASLVLPLLKSERMVIRVAALEILGRLSARECIAGILPLLEDGRSHVRAAAITALARLYAKESSAKIREMLGDGNVAVRAAAIEALTILNGKDAVNDVLPFRHDAEIFVRFVAYDALVNLLGKEAIPHIAPFINDPTDDGRLVMSALCSIPVDTMLPQVVPSLLLLLESDKEFTREQGIYCLKSVGAREAVPAIRRLLKDRSTFVRTSAVYALAGLGARECLPELRACLKDPDAGVRRTTIGALATLDATAATIDITPFLRDDDADIRNEAVVALINMGSKDSFQDVAPRILAGVMNDEGRYYSNPRPSVALAKTGSAAAARCTRFHLHSPTPDVRCRTEYLVADNGLKEMIPTLKELLDDGDSTVRASAYLALTELGEKIACSPEMLRDLRSAYNKRFLRETWGARYDAALRRIEGEKK